MDKTIVVTEDMLEAAWAVKDNGRSWCEQMTNMFQAMIAAAPAPAAQDEREDESNPVYAAFKSQFDPDGRASHWHTWRDAVSWAEQRLAAQPADKPEGKAVQQAEPVAYVLKTGHGTGIRLRISSLDPEVQKMWQPLYAHPPAQPQQLTDEEISAAIQRVCGFPDLKNGELSLKAELRALLAAGKSPT